MPSLIDLSALAPATLPFTDRHGQEWVLRDTVPTEALIRGFDLLEMDSALTLLSQTPFTPSLTPSEEMTVEQQRRVLEEARRYNAEQHQAVKAAVAARLALTTELAVTIFQATYPDMGHEDIVRVLPSYWDQRLIVDHFFRSHFFGSSGRSSASTPPDAPTTPSGNAASSSVRNERAAEGMASVAADAPVTAPMTMTTPTRATTRPAVTRPAVTQAAKTAGAKKTKKPNTPRPASGASRRPNGTSQQAMSQRPALRAVPKPTPRPQATPSPSLPTGTTD